MAKRKASKNGETQFPITQANLDRKGKTNKKLRLNTMASKYLTPKGRELKDAAEKLAKETFRKGRRHRKSAAPES